MSLFTPSRHCFTHRFLICYSHSAGCPWLNVHSWMSMEFELLTSGKTLLDLKPVVGDCFCICICILERLTLITDFSNTSLKCLCFVTQWDQRRKSNLQGSKGWFNQKKMSGSSKTNASNYPFLGQVKNMLLYPHQSHTRHENDANEFLFRLKVTNNHTQEDQENRFDLLF